MPRSDRRKAAHDLLKDVCNPTSHDSLRKSVGLEIKVRSLIFFHLSTSLSYFKLTNGMMFAN